MLLNWRQVTEGNQLRYFKGGDLIAEVPADTLVLGGGRSGL